MDMLWYNRHNVCVLNNNMYRCKVDAVRNHTCMNDMVLEGGQPKYTIYETMKIYSRKLIPNKYTVSCWPKNTQ
jgi:hypothetical protein